MEAKKLAKELEERKKKGNGLLRPQSAKTMNLGMLYVIDFKIQDQTKYFTVPYCSEKK